MQLVDRTAWIELADRGHVSGQIIKPRGNAEKPQGYAHISHHVRTVATKPGKPAGCIVGFHETVACLGHWRVLVSGDGIANPKRGGSGTRAGRSSPARGANAAIVAIPERRILRICDSDLPIYDNRRRQHWKALGSRGPAEG